MILEVAILQVKPNQTAEFENNFRIASEIISQMQGYLKHQLQRCLEVENKYVLLVEWENLTDHTEGFRGSAEYKKWKELLHRFYDPFPTVEHFELVFESKV